MWRNKMTNKQIIIDGVDIKDCKRRLGKDNFCRYYKRPCAENNYNCIWKKYLRKEQELQEAMDNYVQLDLQRVKEYNELVDLYKAKEQECEELKKAIDGLLKIQYQLADSCTKYEQTLAEIKEICNSVENIENINSLYDAKLSGMYLQAHKILQKISECEGNNDMENN